MDQAMEFSAEISGMGTYTVKVEENTPDRQQYGQLAVTVDGECGGERLMEMHGPSEYNATTRQSRPKTFAEMSEQEARGLGIEMLMDCVQEDRDEFAFAAVFEDYKSRWARYDGDSADEAEMLRFLDGLIETIAQARRQVPMKADQVKWERANPEKVKAIQERIDKEYGVEPNHQGPIPFPLPVKKEEAK